MNAQSNKNQLVYLFFTNFAILFTGMGLFPILPLYATHFGANSTMIGIYLALTYLSITAGTLMTGWLAGRMSRIMFLGAGLAGLPALIGMGYAASYWQVVALTAVTWFSGGIGLALASVYASQAANGRRRGLAFSVQSLASPLAALFGGLAVGHIAEWRGYPFMFATLALVWTIWPALALTKITNSSEKEAPAPKQSGAAKEKLSSERPASAFSHLLLAVLLSAITVSIGRLGLSLMMKDQAFSLIEISSTSTISGLVAMPAILILGSYSDRLGHRRMLIFTYLIAALGAFTLVAANHLWQYWLSAVLLLVALNSSRSLAIATAAGTLSSQQQARRLPWIYTTNWAAGIVGFASSGILIETLGAQILFLAAAGLSLLSALLAGSPWQHISFRLPALHRQDIQPCSDQ